LALSLFQWRLDVMYLQKSGNRFIWSLPTRQVSDGQQPVPLQNPAQDL
jgi:hypothetical protein